MKEIEKKRISNNNKSKRSGKSERRDIKVQQGHPNRSLKEKETESRASSVKSNSNTSANNLNISVESTEVYQNVDLHYIDDIQGNTEAFQESKVLETVDQGNNDLINGHSCDLQKEPKEGIEEGSDSESVYDSVSSQGGSQEAEDERVNKGLSITKGLVKEDISDSSYASTVEVDRGANNSQNKLSHDTPNKATKSSQGSYETTKDIPDKNSKNMKVHPKPQSESSEGDDDIHIEEVKAVDVLDDPSIGSQSVGSDDEPVNLEKNCECKDREAVNQKIFDLEERMEKLEEELREVAALEISLYSVVPEHGSSAHKVHTPARRLSRIYIHACKHWSQDKRATVARNTISGLVLVAKSCGNDVSRLTFWLSNMVVLREIIAQAFGSSCQLSSLTKAFDSNEREMKSERKSSALKWKGGSVARQQNKHSFMQFVDDWKETKTFTAALEKVESWIFSRMVESIWWQTLMPNMQSLVEDLNTNEIGRLLGPGLGDHEQGNLSINLWKYAFQDAFKRLCPVRGAGHECGCIPFLTRMVMDHCVARLDVAMFNAILRESAHEIPTDPVSDPIVDAKVLPIPAGDLSFGSGVQLKNSVCNWSRWLKDSLGVDIEDSSKEDQKGSDTNDEQGGDEPKYFHLLNSLADLLMLPKDMLMDRSIREEVCPPISLPLMKRILCNFTPDEFCPDAVPGAVLEALNAECIIECRLSTESASSFPYTAAPVVYTPPSANGIHKTAEASGKSLLARSASVVRRKGYTSDEELEELDYPSAHIACGNGIHKGQSACTGANSRYALLREVWQA